MTKTTIRQVLWYYSTKLKKNQTDAARSIRQELFQ